MKHNGQRTRIIIMIAILAIFFRVMYQVIINQLAIQYPFTQFLSTISTWLVNIIAVLIWINIVLKSDYSVAKLPWLLILIIEPFTGIFFFLTFGRDYRESGRFHRHPLFLDGQYLTREAKTDFTEEGLQRINSEVTDIFKQAYNMTGHHAYLEDSKATVLHNDSSFFPTLKESIKRAKDFILIQFYIIRPDKIGNEIFDLLKEKSKEGVEVKILFDSLGSYKLKTKDIVLLKEHGIEVEEIDPILFGVFDTRINYRNHRKQVIIDGKVAIVGGINIGDEYQEKIASAPEFRDTSLQLEGMIVNSVTALFFRDWYSTTDVFIDDEKYYQAQTVSSDGLMQIIPSGPDFKYPPIRNTYVKIINNAKKSIKIMTPYLALDHELATSLIIAARSGVEVSIIVPGVPDKRLIYEVTQSFFESLLEEGVRIYQYKDKFTHAKVLIMDDMIASCGTYNLDNRSARINYEATVLLYKEAVKDLSKDFEEDLSHCEEILYEEWKNRNTVKKLVEGIISIVAPLV